MALKHLLTTNPLLVGYILTSSLIYDQYRFCLAFTLLFLNIFNCLWFSQGSYRSQSIKGHFKNECICVKLIGNCIKNFLNEQFLHTPVGLTIEKKELFNVLSYLHNLPLALITCLRNSVNKNLPYCKIGYLLIPGYVMLFCVSKIKCLFTYALM